MIPFIKIQAHLSVLPAKMKAAVQSSVSVNQDLECEECGEVISIIENWLDQSEDQQMVIQAIEVVCTYMPDWESTCDAMVESGVPTVVQWIDEYENETVVCGQLGLCQSLKPEIKKPATLPLPGDDCSECESIITTIENWMASNYSIETMASYLEILCTLVPQYTSVCDSYITNNLVMIIKYIESEESPADICAALGACSNKLFVENMKSKMNSLL